MKPLTSASPHAVIMIGIPGAGKSTFAERFATTFKAPIVNQGKLQHLYGLSAKKAEALRNSILNEYLKTQKTVVIDGGLGEKEKRETMVRALVKAGYRPLIVWVQTDTNEAYRRATRPYPKGSGLSDDAFDTLLAKFQAPGEKEKMVVISGKHTYTSQLKIVLKQLAVADHSQPEVPTPASATSPQTAPSTSSKSITVRNATPSRGTLLR